MIQPLSPGEHTKAGLDQAWPQLGQAGGWFDGQERIAIAAQARAARQCRFCTDRKAALSPYAVEGDHDESETDLSNLAIDTIHRIATDPCDSPSHLIKRIGLGYSDPDGRIGNETADDITCLR